MQPTGSSVPSQKKQQQAHHGNNVFPCYPWYCIHDCDKPNQPANEKKSLYAYLHFGAPFVVAPKLPTFARMVIPLSRSWSMLSMTLIPICACDKTTLTVSDILRSLLTQRRFEPICETCVVDGGHIPHAIYRGTSPWRSQRTSKNSFAMPKPTNTLSSKSTRVAKEKAIIYSKKYNFMVACQNRRVNSAVQVPVVYDTGDHKLKSTQQIPPTYSTVTLKYAPSISHLLVFPED